MNQKLRLEIMQSKNWWVNNPNYFQIIQLLQESDIENTELSCPVQTVLEYNLIQQNLLRCPVLYHLLRQYLLDACQQ